MNLDIYPILLIVLAPNYAFISAGIDLQNCLHPSEYDKPPDLLLCRANSKLEQDIIGKDSFKCCACCVVRKSLLKGTAQYSGPPH
jgi:hypothetical protein